jgi:hypothetical protein
VLSEATGLLAPEVSLAKLAERLVEPARRSDGLDA